ncbi:hypothetical protein AU381_03620 [Sinorhizobium glycinis]|uniref:Uncharacterized protein n=1 Tax=Sinorhizobium glycinis TaxID=1472378 RepID=A0A178Y0N6_9HYPH|nr:hypothetical protein [Sinorhizobium glycinis]OAP40986.1 hypothetical protein AU381_03620 [Sinorhizobium glycinis]
MLRHSDSPTRTSAADRGTGDAPAGNSAIPRAADWLSLAAAPTFAIMALLTGLLGPPDMLCSPAGDAYAVTGMVPMYALMSAFHTAPWLRLISSRRGAAPSSWFDVRNK